MKKQQKNYDEKLVKSLAKSITLNVFRVGSDPKNYNILEKLPANMSQIMGWLKVSKMPANRRINELEKAGLLKRHRYEGKLEATALTKVFLGVMDGIQDDVLKGIPRI